MKKIPSLFKRNHKTHRCYNEVTEGCEWVLPGEGIATVKVDGTCCKMEDGILYKRYDRKLNKHAYKVKKKNPNYALVEAHFKTPPPGWTPCEPSFDPITGHWPGWAHVTEDDKWHVEAFKNHLRCNHTWNDTCELVGRKVQGNPYHFAKDRGHELWRHGNHVLRLSSLSFESLEAHLSDYVMEGIVFHHPNGRMCKVKRKDFGLKWPMEVKK